MASLVSENLADILLGPLESMTVHLHTGNPGAAGTENKAKETEAPLAEFAAAAAKKRLNKNNIEWVEVKFKETYKFFSLWNATGTVLKGWGEFTAPIEVEVGDTFRIVIGNLTISLE
jgi:hypothetical protein